MTFILALIAIIVSLILVVGTHEAGHALAAQYFGVRIERISIGFGKPLLSWQSKSGITWAWARWPLGGYVKLLNHRITPVTTEAYPQCFDKKPMMARIIILISGALVNILMAWCAFVLVFMLGYQAVPATIHQVNTPSIAAKAGVKAGDTIVSVNQEGTPTWREVGMVLITHLDQERLPITVKNKTGKERKLQLDVRAWRYTHQKNALLAGLGITIHKEEMQRVQVPGVSFLTANQQAFCKIKTLTIFFFLTLKQLVTGQLPLALLLGPLGLFAAITHSFMQGLSIFCDFIGTLSLAVAIVNLMPIPGLDGGAIVYALIEKIRGKPMSIALEVLLHQLAFIAFCVLLAQLIINDLVRLFGAHQ